jgi:hypothetical protein
MGWSVLGSVNLAETDLRFVQSTDCNFHDSPSPEVASVCYYRPQGGGAFCQPSDSVTDFLLKDHACKQSSHLPRAIKWDQG